MFGSSKGTVLRKPVAKPGTPASGDNGGSERVSAGKGLGGSQDQSKIVAERLEQYHDLKARIHRKLVEQLDLARLNADDESMRAQVQPQDAFGFCRITAHLPGECLRPVGHRPLSPDHSPTRGEGESRSAPGSPARGEGRKTAQRVLLTFSRFSIHRL